MSAVDLILQQEREREQQEAERKKREDAAFSVVMALPAPERAAVLARLINAFENAAAGSPTKPVVVAATKPDPATKANTPSYVDLAEAFVLAHPEGVKTRQVADGIGQDTSSVDGTLRIVLNKRKTIERRGRLWFPKKKANGATVKAKPQKKTIRDLIGEVYAASEKKHLGALEMYEGLKRIKPDINRASVDGEINRMKTNKPPLLVQVGNGPHGGGLYALSNDGGAAASVN